MWTIIGFGFGILGILSAFVWSNYVFAGICLIAMLVSAHISDEKNIKAIRSLDEELRPKQYKTQSGQPSPNVAKQNHVLSNLHPMIFVFTSPLHVGGNTIEKLGISGN